jgi:hypothetical protein
MRSQNGFLNRRAVNDKSRHCWRLLQHRPLNLRGGFV